MQLKKAERKHAKLRLALTGPSGAGKTFSALILARNFGRVAVIDTERGSASLYAHLCDFDTIELDPPYTPERFLEAMKLVQNGGYDICVIDSITHEWNGVGGCLELVDTLAAAKYRGNTWAAWNDVTPRHRLFMDMLNQIPMHIIATMRSKTETAQIEEGNKKKVVKLGMKSEQRDGSDYEFTTVLDLVHDGHFALASKDRTELFNGSPEVITDATAKKLIGWLNSGVDPKQEAVRRSKEVYQNALAAIDGWSGDKVTLSKIRQTIMTRVQEGSLSHDQGEELLARCAKLTEAVTA